jgi:hypothetical protein
LEASAWHATTFTKNWRRLLDGKSAGQLLAQTVDLSDPAPLRSGEHFWVEGTLLEAWSSQRSGRPVDDDHRVPVDPTNIGVSFHGRRRTNQTHFSLMDPDARLARKSSNIGSLRANQARSLVDKQHGLVMNAVVGSPSGQAPIQGARRLLQGIAGMAPRATVCVCNGYGRSDFVAGARAAGFTP